METETKLFFEYNRRYIDGDEDLFIEQTFYNVKININQANTNLNCVVEQYLRMYYINFIGYHKLTIWLKTDRSPVGDAFTITHTDLGIDSIIENTKQKLSVTHLDFNGVVYMLIGICRKQPWFYRTQYDRKCKRKLSF